MDFVRYYDAYWQAKPDDEVDRNRLELLAQHVRTGERVLQVDCGPGWLPAMMQARGATVVATDLSHVAVARARGRGVDARQCDLDAGPLPFADGEFDVVVSDSQLEHRVDYAHALDEMARVLRSGGRLILLLPNTAHWRVRLWLLAGRFPYVDHTPTDPLHLRFFTLSDVRCLLADRGLAIEQTDGSASLWVEALYPGFLRRGWPARLYTALARRRPGLFARDFIIVARKPSLLPSRGENGSAGVWECGSTGVWESGSAGVWESGSAGVWESGSTGVWECGSTGVWESGSTGAPRRPDAQTPTPPNPHTPTLPHSPSSVATGEDRP